MLAALRDEDVPGPDLAVDDPLVGEVVEGPGETGGGLQEVDLGQVRLVVAEVSVERPEMEVLRHEDRRLRLTREAEPEDRAETGVLPAHHLLGELDELELVAGDPLPPQLLDGHLPGREVSVLEPLPVPDRAEPSLSEGHLHLGQGRGADDDLLRGVVLRTETVLPPLLVSPAEQQL